jgi:quercetin dioxygenase-like cupin family protein
MTHAVRSRAQSDSAAVRESWGTLRWLANHALSGSAITVGRVIIYKGQRNPRHSHPNCEEVLYLLAGRLIHSVGSQTVTLNAGDTLAIPAGVVHNAQSVGDVDADMIVTYSSGHRDFLPETAGESEGE